MPFVQRIEIGQKNVAGWNRRKLAQPETLEDPMHPNPHLVSYLLDRKPCFWQALHLIAF